MTYKEEIKKAFIDKVSEILDKPLKDARIQLDYHYDEVSTIRYDVTEYIIPYQKGGKE
jgi:frataxin-like iron-binding protein CyaY